MSKEVSDVLNRLEGDLIALQGMKGALSPPPVDPPPAPPPKAKREDYQEAKKLIDEIAGLAKSLGEQLDQELKVPASAPQESQSPHSGSGSETHDKGKK